MKKSVSPKLDNKRMVWIFPSICWSSVNKQVVSQLPFSSPPSTCTALFVEFVSALLMPARRPKETLLQVKERTAREIRNRTEARVRALLKKGSESEESSSDEEDLIFVPSSPTAATKKHNTNLLAYWLCSIIVILLLVILLLTQHIYLTRSN